MRRCKVCGKDIACLYVWSTHRDLNREKVARVTKAQGYERTEVMNGDYIVCMWCTKEHGLVD